MSFFRVCLTNLRQVHSINILLDPIERVLGKTDGGFGYTPQNLGNAHNFGAEFEAKKFFGEHRCFR